jgi:hypothetical protein
LKNSGINHRYTPINADLSKKWLEFYPKSVFICALIFSAVPRRFLRIKIEIGENPE